MGGKDKAVQLTWLSDTELAKLRKELGEGAPLGGRRPEDKGDGSDEEGPPPKRHKGDGGGQPLTVRDLSHAVKLMEGTAEEKGVHLCA